MSKDIVAQKNGMIIGESFQQRMDICKVLVSSGMLPKAYKTPEQAFIGIQYALEMGFTNSPIMALKNIAVINGQPSLWGDLPKAMVIRSGKLEYMNEFFIDKNGTVLDPKIVTNDNMWAAVCQVKRTGFDQKEFSFNRQDEHGLGVEAIWKKFKKIMYMRKARSLAINSEFSDILNGAPIAEYEHHTAPDIIEGGVNEKGEILVEVLPAEKQKTNNLKEKLGVDL